MTENQIYEVLKNISLLDAFLIISKRCNIPNETNNIDIYYTAKDLYRLYPNVFSKYKLDKYIKEENFPVINKGKNRLFKKEYVEEWLNTRSELKYNLMRK